MTDAKSARAMPRAERLALKKKVQDYWIANPAAPTDKVAKLFNIHSATAQDYRPYSLRWMKRQTAVPASLPDSEAVYLYWKNAPLEIIARATKWTRKRTANYFNQFAGQLAPGETLDP